MAPPSLALTLLATCLAGAASAAEVAVSSDRRGGVWSYRIENDAADPVSIVTLSVRGPIRVVGTPKGWKAETDGCSTVSWSTDDRDVAARGGKLAGFAIKSKVKSQTRREITLVHWDTKNSRMGAVSVVGVDAPDNGKDTCAQD